MLGAPSVPSGMAAVSSLAVFRLTKFVSTSVWVNGEPLPVLLPTVVRVTIVVMG